MSKSCFRSQFRFVAGSKIESHEVKHMKEKLGWTELEKRLTGCGESGDNSTLYIPGGGIAKSLFEEW